MTKSKAKIAKFEIPKEVSYVTDILKSVGFEAYLVGGCVRDLFMSRKPKDWDVTTSATPEEIIASFPKTFYENEFGTVAVVNEVVKDQTLKIIEVTPYRTESDYLDHRRPDKVTFSKDLQDDLKRRDFSINAVAYDPETGEIEDPFGGVADLAQGVIKTVGKPDERFYEDGLRILRAIRFRVELDFSIDPDTEKSILKNKEILREVSQERIRDELIKIVMSDRPMEGFLLLQKLELLPFVIPELEETIGVEQNQAHAYDVWTHLLKSLQHAANKKYPLHVRLAALLHDISKPKTRRKDPETNQWTFYGHEVVGSHVTKTILERLSLSRETIDRVVDLVRWHMFFSDPDKITPSAVRRIISRVGKENIWDLINVRICDRVGTGRPKEEPYRLRKYEAMIEEVIRDPVSVGMLKIDGNQIKDILNEPGGPRVGDMLNALLEEVLEDPTLNTEEYLIKRVKELGALVSTELKSLSQKGKEKKEELEEKEIEQIRKRHHVE